VDDLYRENILDHYKHPHNWSPPAPAIEHPNLEFHDLNPLCGDELTVQLAVSGEGRIEDVRFAGHGCAISQAAASMTSDEVKGMPVDDLLRLDRLMALGVDQEPDARRRIELDDELAGLGDTRPAHEAELWRAAEHDAQLRLGYREAFAGPDEPRHA